MLAQTSFNDVDTKVKHVTSTINLRKGNDKPIKVPKGYEKNDEKYKLPEGFP